MPIASKSKTRSTAKGARVKSGAIQSRESELAAAESQLQEKIAALQRTIAEAPNRAAEKARQDRNALLAGSRGFHLHSVVPDSRYGVGSGEVVRRQGKRPMLRHERHAARQQTLALIVVLAVAVVWMLSHFVL